MKIYLLPLLLLTVSASLAQTTLQPVWDGGLKLRDNEKRYEITTGANVNADIGFNDSDDSVSLHNSQAFFRRARLNIGATFSQRLRVFLEFDFAGGAAFMKDAFISFRLSEQCGWLTAGHIKEPIGLDELTSSKTIMFMERDMPSLSAPSRNLGVLYSNHFLNERLGLYAGGFANTNNQVFVRNIEDNYALTGRMAALPLFNKEKNLLLHVGASYSYRTNEFDEISLALRPESRFSGLSSTETGNIEIANNQLAAGEAIISIKSFNLQGESMTSFAADFRSNAVSVKASYVINGRRLYNSKNNTLSKIEIDEPLYSAKGGIGAFEIAARYSTGWFHYNIISSEGIKTFTFGINWYLINNVRIMANYVRYELDLKGENSFMARLQFHL